MAEKKIVVDTADLSTPVGETVHVRIGGEVFEARCPKDAVLAKLAKSQRDEADTLESMQEVVSGIIGTAGGERVAEMLVSADHKDVTLRTLNDLVEFLMNSPEGPQWTKALEESLKSMGSGEPPRTVPVKRAAKKTTARKPAKPAAARR